MRFRRRFGAVLLVAAAVQLPQTTAYANHEGAATTGVLNTVNWKVCIGGTTASINSTVRALGLIDATAVNPVRVSCTSGTQNVTVWSKDHNDLSPTARGFTKCSGIYNSTNNRCNEKKVELYISTITTSADPVKQWQKTACHELGHVGGLGDRPAGVITSCLEQGDSPPIYTTYDDHDRGSLNDTYK